MTQLAAEAFSDQSVLTLRIMSKELNTMRNLMPAGLHAPWDNEH